MFYAQKVEVINKKKKVENDNSAQKRAELQAEINHPSTKVSIDRSVFIKTPEEKDRIKICKMKY